MLRKCVFFTQYDNQKLLINKTFGCASLIYNHFLDKCKNTDLSIRNWICEECGNENDRDINASINIMYEGIKLHYQNK